MKKTITCRYGTEYEVNAHGTKGEQQRLFDLLEHCCCWVCHNHDCKTPKNRKIKDCGNVCELWNSDKVPFCKKSKKTKKKEA